MNIIYFKELFKLDISEKESKIIELLNKVNNQIIILPLSYIVNQNYSDFFNNEHYIEKLQKLNNQISKHINDNLIIYLNYDQDRNLEFLIVSKEISYQIPLNSDLSLSNCNFNLEFTFNQQLYKLHFLEVDVINDAAINILLSKNSYDLFNQMTYDNLLIINDFNIYNDGKVIKNYFGEISYQNKFYQNFDEELIDLNILESKKLSLLEILIFNLKYYHQKVLNSRFNWVIGVSGGLDSAINFYLLSQAVEKERIFAYNLPSIHNSTATKNIANILADRLGIKLQTIGINNLFQETLNLVGEEKTNDLVRQNIQARLRGHLLATLASMNNAVIINNGNKVEVFFGYATMYGDMVGSFSPLADLCKDDLIELIYQINLHQEIIPHQLVPNNHDLNNWIQKPSAELANNQFDPMKWYYHDRLIKILNPNYNLLNFMHDYYEDKLDLNTKQLIKYYGLDDGKKFIEDINFVLKAYRNNKFKYKYYPQSLILTSNPISGNYYLADNFEENEFKDLSNKICGKSQ